MEQIQWLARCGLIESVVQSLFNLIEHQLDELILTFNESVVHRINYVKDHMPMFPDRDNQSIVYLIDYVKQDEIHLNCDQLRST
ncbi:unnamed protein product [Rotaria sp. Silwood2]|nr:unnamed protein product [Rotaria sp. Silwood2]CAF3126847.1 unnamed protein product [Rotaria sp. Silwood2]CAF3166088.1 unnamed protein product [Rotaria sp. Silwood2]CAF3297653.1 unnamed protein product [Rotaria sp. Silwood2]CAF4474130.1 unnamed protein product [Rotaria sp. Silwood2]